MNEGQLWREGRGENTYEGANNDGDNTIVDNNSTNAVEGGQDGKGQGQEKLSVKGSISSLPAGLFGTYKM